MDRKKTMLFLLDLVFLAGFNAVFFLSGGANGPSSTWISYAFIHLAYIMVLASPYLVRQSSSSAVFAASVGSISSTHFLIQLVIGAIIILTRTESDKLPLIIHIVVTCAYAAYLLSHLLANEATAAAVQVHEQEAAYIKHAAAKVKLLASCMDDKQGKRELERLYGLLHASPSKSSSSVRSLEMEIMDRISDLNDSVSAGNLHAIFRIAKDIRLLVEKRNIILK